jgi:putative ABC transport system permease protein
METIRQALDALRQHTFRSVLTLSGITWGIVAVTLLNSYGDGFHRTIMRAFDAFGKDVVILWPGQTSEQAGGERSGQRIRFEGVEDAERIRNECPLVKAVSPELVRRTQVATETRLVAAPVRGVWPSYGSIRNEAPDAGRFLNDDDLRERRRVVFLGDHIRTKLFGNSDPVGQTVTINGMHFTVIGWMEKKVSFGGYFAPDDYCVWIPYTTAGDLWDNRYASVLVFEPVNGQAERAAVAQVRAVLGRYHRFSATDKRAVIASGREEFRPIVEAITIGLQIVLVFVGTLTLGIGGVGVMNIMLVSVTERTREIGLRMAVGARRSRILGQFLSEALVLTAIGGALGILISAAIIHSVGMLPLMGALFEDTSGKGDITMQLAPNTVFVSVLVLTLVGLVSGFFPALRASRMDPVEALRYE